MKIPKLFARCTATTIAAAALMFGLVGSAKAEINNQPQEDVEAGYSFYSSCRTHGDEYAVMTYTLAGKHLYTKCTYTDGTVHNRHFYSLGSGFTITQGPHKYVNKYDQKFTGMDFVSKN